ncbi:MAG: hypothetical protein AAFQ63_11015 [Cyanobacteria bacterium J06621_11]
MPAKRISSTTASRSWLPTIVIALGIALTLCTQLFTQNGVLFSGDSGLKALLTEQLAAQMKAGSFPLDVALNLPGAAWVQNLWQAGLYPFTTPFVYETNAQHFTASSFAFPLVSAPFYTLLGERGLYVVPLVSLWVIWLRFWQIGTRARWGTAALCAGLLTLIFASPLSLYGGIYGEYTLAVAIAFWGLSNLILPKKGTLSRPNLLWSGFLIGLSVWFRPEFIALAFAVSLIAIFHRQLAKWRLTPKLTASQAFILIGGMVCNIGLLLAINYGIYGQVLGAASSQLAQGFGNQLSVVSKPSYLSTLNALQIYFPMVWVIGLAALFSPELRKSTVKISPLKSSQLQDKKGQYFDRLGLRKTANSLLTPSRFALGISILFALIAPLATSLTTLFANGESGTSSAQWGPKLYLILMPLLSVVLAEQFRSSFFHTAGRRLLTIGIAIALLLGIHINIAGGIFTFYQTGPNTSLKANYEQTAPAITALQEEPSAWIAISDGRIAQRLWSAVPEKTFFRIETDQQLTQLAAALVTQEESKFLYMCYPQADCLATSAQTNNSQGINTEATNIEATDPETTDLNGNEWALADGQHRLTLEPVGDYGRYPTYQGVITETVAEAITPPATDRSAAASPNANSQETNSQTTTDQSTTGQSENTTANPE